MNWCRPSLTYENGILKLSPKDWWKLQYSRERYERRPDAIITWRDALLDVACEVGVFEGFSWKSS